MFKREVPKGVIFLTDTSIVVFSLLAAFLIRFNFNIPESEYPSFYYVFPLVIGTRVLCFLCAKTHAAIIRYTSTKDIQRLLVTGLAGSVFISILNIFTYLADDFFAVPYSIVIIEFLLSFFLMSSFRVLVKILYIESMNPSRNKTNVVIFGAGEAGVITKRTLDRDAGTRYNVLAFVDDDDKKSGKKVEGVTIYQTNKYLDRILSENEAQHLIIAIQNLNPKRKQEIIEICLKHKTKVLNVPPVTNWINGNLSLLQLKKVKIEDLLERECINLDFASISKQIHGKRILITGAAGSIGSEIVRQILKFKPGQLIMLDCAESAMYELENEIRELDKQHVSISVIADIRNKGRMLNIFRSYHPHIVFHAAAYKHVPLMEANPAEAILTNVLGTKVVANLSDKFGVEKFVMISTDKAVNPTGIMGATKRVAEMYIQSLNKQSQTRFITTRFGNVLGSSGSVIPTFNKLIELRKPITVTHPEITRYFMTIPEACQLVLEAGAMGKGGEIFIFDMGKSVKIVDLAKKMVQLSGLELGKDIQLTFTGLRPGEKLYEELLANEENTLPTHHKKIMIAKVIEYDYETVDRKVSDLISIYDHEDDMVIVSMMKEMIPEFKSNNSVFEELDREGV